MIPSEFVALKYRLDHAKTSEQKRLVIDNYPDLKGKSIKDVIGMIQAHTWVTTGVDFKEQKKRKKSRYWAGVWRKKL
jgi:hypothetical protein